MNTFETIKTKAAKYPELTCVVDEKRLSIDPSNPDGFNVWMIASEDGYTVGYDGWHEEFEDEVEALNCFALGLSEECRLKTISRGGKPSAWIVEYLQDGEWLSDSETGLIFVPFWRKKSIQYRQNHVIKIREHWGTIDADAHCD